MAQRVQEVVPQERVEVVPVQELVVPVQAGTDSVPAPCEVPLKECPNCRKLALEQVLLGG